MQAALTSRDRMLRIATWSVIASEALMFAALFVAHGGVRPEPKLGELALAATVAGLLVAASLALASAIHHVRAERPQLATKRLALVIVLGVAAVALELVAAGLFTTRDPLGLVILGLHAAHTAAAVALAGWAIALTRCGRVRHGRCGALELVATYWYFVAVLWIFVGPLVTT